MSGSDWANLRLIDHETVASTNDEALILAGKDAPAWTVVRARSQSAGRGRRGKSFASPPGNSYTSFILRPQCEPAEAPQIALVAGLAVAETVDFLAPDLPRAVCKWPNDVMIDSHKVAGILVEAALSGSKLDAVIVGLGVNLLHHPEIPGVRIASLHGLGAPEIERDRWLECFVGCFMERFGLWQSQGFSALQDIWMERAAGLGGRVSLDTRPPLQGTLKGLAPDGALLIDDDNGITHRCVSGSLVLEDAA
ncbi:MAG: biotin--[acetyl-CoA-carboxylase] ligase [Rhodospirillaceae bacterium]|nr:biotin--[acetyl-CoA-carboxylase] ligase [Rhodospirillaceae bacterium]